MAQPEILPALERNEANLRRFIGALQQAGMDVAALAE
jgi:hypothetical protein